jgi:phosphoribosylanthranilate isomerase
LAKPGDRHRNQDQLLFDEARHLVTLVPTSVDSVVLSHATNYQALAQICSLIAPRALQIQRQTDATVLQRLRFDFPNVTLITKVGISSSSEANSVLDHVAQLAANAGVSHFVLDSVAGKAGRGGTGEVHDWALSAHIVSAFPRYKFILAGGLHSENVVDAIRTVRPHGVDVMSGVSSQPGVKDLSLVNRFVQSARGALDFHGSAIREPET